MYLGFIDFADQEVYVAYGCGFNQNFPLPSPNAPIRINCNSGHYLTTAGKLSVQKKTKSQTHSQTLSKVEVACGLSLAEVKRFLPPTGERSSRRVNTAPLMLTSMEMNRAVMQAVRNDKGDIVDYLFNVHHAVVSLGDREGDDTPMVYAANRGRVDWVIYLNKKMKNTW
jgi:hypothetical protein